MVLANTADHLQLSQSVQSFLAKREALSLARATLDGAASMPPFWADMAELGWTSLHIAEEHGGSGFGLLELAVVVYEMGRTCTPGPFIPTVVVSGSVSLTGDDAQKAALLPGLADGSVTAGFGLAGALELADGVLSGDAGPVVCGAYADLLALRVGDDLVILDRGADGVTITDRANLDTTRPAAAVTLSGVAVPAGRTINGGAATLLRLARVLLTAEAAGGAAACTDMASAYAKDRTAFGRPIGGFQAIKHHCANMFIEAELATAAAWDAARSELAGPSYLTVDTAVAVAVPALLRCAEINIQVHGGIGFTWEHDAHLFLRRAGALNALLGPVEAAEAAVAAVAGEPAAGSGLELPPEAEQARTLVREFAAAYWALPEDERHQYVADSGYLFPHWPAPYGIAASPVAQLVIEEELADVPRMQGLGPTWWTLPIILPTIMTYGTEEQKDRWIRPTMEARISWCQLFSEPGAGSDLAALSTRAERADGGWKINGQKVWTSYAHLAQVGLILVRTNREAAKHRGITAMVVDMSAPGVSVRPLKQITGESRFNEVFFDDVFIPDADVVGPLDGGWAVARTALGNERVTLGDAGWDSGEPWERLVEIVLADGPLMTPDVCELGRWAARTHAARALNVRAAARAVAGGEPGVEGNLAKLVSAETGQKIADLGMKALGSRAVYADGPEELLNGFFLMLRMVTLAGGTSEIVRNILGERILGLPRDQVPTS
jgi:alkylation response protein AidB-like acyl-CoA dehydrogenase